MTGSEGATRRFNPARAFYVLLLASGVALYFLWAIVYDAWLDIGLYSIVVLMVSFGLVGYLLYGIAPEGGKR
ncbi:MAG: hypothetical protein FJ149_07100 [Euryarchaeota archaeon]|nr:hypothetical protein [Euryarchaeota archaeon]